MSDLRHAIRTLSATPIVTIAAVLSLALGIGANTAIFSLIDSLVLRTLPVAEPERLVMLRGPGDAWSNPVWEQLREHRQLFDGAFGWFPTRFNLAQSGEARMVDGIWATGDFFPVLGVQAVIGRTFTEADDRRGGGPDGPVAVIGYAFWQRHFGGSTQAVGARLVVERVPYTVVGVTPRGFFGPDVGRAFDVIIPVGTEPLVRGQDSWLDHRTSRFLRVMLRLKPGQTIKAATAALVAIQPQVREATLPPERNPTQLATYLTRPFSLEPAARGDSSLRRSYQGSLFLLLGIVGSVLLIACANVANLLLARAAARRHEISVMRALGATRWTLARQLLIESLVLAGAGAVLGIVFAQWASRYLVQQLSTRVSTVYLDLGLDWRVLGFTTMVGMGTALLFGIVPALRAARVDPIESIKEQGRGPSTSRRSSVAGTLVVVQVALSLALLVGAALFLQTFTSLASRPLGFESERLIVIGVNAPFFREGELGDIYAQVKDRAAAVPGVERVAMSRVLPVGSGEASSTFYLDADTPPARLSGANYHEVSPDWFATMGIPIVAGRDITRSDRVGTPGVALVNEAFVRRFLTGANPIGRTLFHFQYGVKGQIASTIVGVVGDTVYRMMREPPPPTMYFALSQRTPQPLSVFLEVRRARESSAALTRALTAAIGEVSRDLTLQTGLMDDRIRDEVARERVLAILSAFFGGLGVLLAGLGLFGVTSYAVSRRRAELSIRLALGAEPLRIIQLVLRRVAMLVGLGLAVGSILTWWLTRFIDARLLYGVQPRDLPTIAAAALLLAAVAVFAGWWPARRAAHIDPASLLREA